MGTLAESSNTRNFAITRFIYIFAQKNSEYFVKKTLTLHFICRLLCLYF